MEKRESSASILDRINPYSIIRDVVRNLWAIALGAIAVGLIMNMYMHTKVENSYSTRATFVVMSRTSGNYAYNNLTAASSVASSLSNVLNSKLLRTKVCEDIGETSFDAVMSANVVPDTNIMTLNVTSDTPWNTYRITRSVMKNMEELTRHVSSDMVMEVLQEPAIPTGADSVLSIRRQMIKAAIIAAIGFTAIFVFLSYKKDTVKSEAELEDRLDAVSLGELYTYSTRPKGALFSKKRNKLLITELTAGFEFVERFKKIAARVATEAEKVKAKVILVTSVKEHEGKTTVASNIGLALARKSGSVLLIDGDLRRPMMTDLFTDEGQKPEWSLNDIIEGRCTLNDALIHDEKRGVYLLLNGRPCSNSTDLVSSETMKRLIALVREVFDYVVIDTPPMSLMADAEIVASAADMSVLTVKYDLVSARDLNDAIDSLRSCGAHFAGCILNEIRSLPGERRTVVGYGGYGRYGKYGRYGRYGKYGRYGRYGNYGNYGSYGAYGAYGAYGTYGTYGARGYYGHYGVETPEDDTSSKEGGADNE